MLHLFCVNNALTLEIAKKIAAEIQPSDFIAIIVVNYRLNIQEVARADQIIGNDMTSKNINGLPGIIFDFQRTSKILKQIEILLSKATHRGRVAIYTPNIHHALTNYLFFSLHKKYPNRQYSYNILAEGSLNFIGQTIGAPYLPKHFFKKALATFYGIKYKPFFGSFCGDDREQIDKIYSPTIKYPSVFPKSVIEVNFKPKTPNKSTHLTGGVLILGQYLDTQIGDTRSRFLNDSFIAWLQSSHNFENISYKGHPLHEDEYMLDLIKQKGGTILDNRVSVESLLSTDHCFTHIISVASSGLLMAKIILGDAVSCTAFGVNFLEKHANHDYAKLRSLYSSFGIEFTELKNGH